MIVHSPVFLVVAALLLGAVSGMRTMLPPAVLALTLSRRPELVPSVDPAQWFTHGAVAIVLCIAALGELVGDKLPSIPNRTALGPFAARVLSGAICGAALVQLGGMNAWTGASCGAAGAAASTIGMFHLRRYAGRVTKVRDPWIGAFEDVIAIATAATVMAMTVTP